MNIIIKREDIAPVLAALIIAVQVNPRGFTAKDIDDVKRVAVDIARQVQGRRP